uniref:Putative secreted protein n=1 Tax=Anopheles darlingi TaxID=43151 RepID=A0A2M4DRB2_ANODA
MMAMASVVKLLHAISFSKSARCANDDDDDDDDDDNDTTVCIAFSQLARNSNHQSCKFVYHPSIYCR